jgi:tetratricopeptide (TPR) repeat protein
MSSFMSSPIAPIAVLAGVTVAVTWLSVTGLRIYRERQTRRRNEVVAEQVKKQLADLRNSPLPQQKHVDQGNNDVEDTGHDAAQWAKEVAGQSASQAQGTVGQDADQRRATEAEPWATFHRGSIFDRQGEYDRAVEAYQQVIDSGHPEVAPRAAFNLGILFEERGEYDRAVEAYQQAMASEHAEWAPKAAFDLGMLVEEHGEYELADQAYQQAIKVYQQVIDSGHPEEAPRAAFDLGLMLDKLGEYNLAEQAYQQAINSGHPEVAPKAMRNLRGLAMKSTARESGGPIRES